jgi:hypothetical protein
MLVCPNCGERNPERFRHCGFCGAKLLTDAPLKEARKLSAEDDLTSQALWRSTRAKALARGGLGEEAAELALAAVKLLGERTRSYCRRTRWRTSPKCSG